MTEPEFLSVDDVLLIHEEQIDAYGGIRGIRDAGLLESAVMMPQASFGGQYLHDGLLKWRLRMPFILRRISPSSTETKELLWSQHWFS